MSEQFILEYIPQRVRQLGFTNYHLRYRDLMIEAYSTLSLAAYNELFFIVDDPPGILIESDYGMYDATDNPLLESVHQHRGEITISNTSMGNRRIKLVQVIIVN